MYRQVIATSVIFSISFVTAHRSECVVEEFRVQKDFDPDKFEGKWYVDLMYSNNLTEAQVDRLDSTHTYLEDGKGNLDLYEQWRPIEDAECNSTQWKLTMPNKDTNISAKMELTNPERYGMNRTAPYWVMDTDYTSYAVVFICWQVDTSSGLCDEIFSWVLVRSLADPLSEEAEDHINDTLNHFCTERSLYEKLRHEKGCLQCKPKEWTVQPNFNVERYMGRWYEQVWYPTRSYPASWLYIDYQHNYALDDQVIRNRVTGRDQSQPEKCFNATKTIIKLTDEPGKMIYFDDKANQTLGYPYWVIETDYENYAFVLGCWEMDPIDKEDCFKHRGWVWSRIPHLSWKHFMKASRWMNQYCLQDVLYYSTDQDNSCNWQPPKPEPNECPTSGSGLFSQSEGPFHLLLTSAVIAFIIKSIQHL